MKLVRRPRSAKRITELILDEVNKGYEELADKAITILDSDVQDWEHKPTFKSYITVNTKTWKFEIKVDRRTKEGKIYTWVDEGTALLGGKGEAYDIKPKHGKALAFKVPHYPKSVPNVVGLIPGIVMSQGIMKQADVVTKKVTHKGIRPRRFSESLRDMLMERERIGGFRSVSEASIKRGLRRAEIT